MVSAAAWLVLSLSAAALAKPRPTREGAAIEYVPNRFIVQFAEKTNARGDPANAFYATLKDEGIVAKPALNISSSVFQGTSFTTTKNIAVGELQGLAGVEKVWLARYIPVPEPEVHAVGSAAQPTWSPHSFTGVEALHKKGIEGEGVVVGVVDTGADYNHPSLGGGIGLDKKILSGVDIVGDNYAGGSYFPDPDAMDRKGHGTHVAGIIAASGDKDFVSVAPKANLRIYKVFGDVYAGTSEDALIQAFAQAHDDGCDVINASIGSVNGWSDSAWGLVASKIAESVFVAIAGGNFGSEGPFYSSSGSVGVNVVSVASINAEDYQAWPAEISLPEKPLAVQYLEADVKPFDLSGDVEVYATSKDSSIANDACAPLPDDTPDLKGKLVLVRRGTCAFSVKEANVAAKGAEWVWFYNLPDRPDIYVSVPSPSGKGVAMISAKSGAAIVNEIAAGNNVTANFPETPVLTSSPNTQSGGAPSDFNSWGPTWEALIKPEVGAPGGRVYSTYPLAQGGYAQASGTSMASPYIAGLAALYIGWKGGRDAMGEAGIADLKKRMLTSCELLQFNNGIVTDTLHVAPVAQQGAGYIKATKLFYDSFVSPGKLELNDTDHLKGGHFINIQNNGQEEVEYTISHEPAATFLTLAPGGLLPSISPPIWVDGKETTAVASFSKTVVSVRPRTTNSFKVTFKPPAGLDYERVPVYSGKIVVAGSNNEVLSIPYQGIQGSLYDSKIWNVEDNEPQYVNDLTNADIKGPVTFTMKGGDQPAAAFFNRMGTREMRWDIVETNWDERHWRYPPKEGENKFVGSAVEAVTGAKWPLTLVPRVGTTRSTYYYYSWAGELANGTKLTTGKYKNVWRVLKINGNPGRSSDWQTVVSPEFTIAP